jgi:tetratricopeptide (TPR) repeat protein
LPQRTSHRVSARYANLLKTFWLFMLLLFWQAPCLAAATTACNPDTLQNFAAIRTCFDHYEKLYPLAAQERPTVLIRLARLAFMLGELSGPAENKQYFRKGTSYADVLVHEHRARVEGHYWRALNLAGRAENSPSLEAYGLLPDILKEIRQALKIDPGYDQAGPHRVLGRIYFEAPGWPFSVGDLGKSIRHLEEAVRLAPHNSTNNLFLGEAYGKAGKWAQARNQLRQVFEATRHSLLPQNLKNDRRKADRLLAKYGGNE